MSEAPSPEGSTPIQRVDRYILVVTPCAPFVRWVNDVEPDHDPEEPDLPFTLEEARTHHVNTYLVPYDFDARPVIAWVEANFDLIFERELAGIEPDPSVWPTERSAEMFLEWFDLRLLDAPIDLVEGPIYISYSYDSDDIPPTNGSGTRTPPST